MYKEVAFDPSCMGSMEYYGLVKQHFGYDHGRYISADIRSWAREAIQYVKTSGLQPVKQQSIKNYLNKLVRSKEPKEFHLAFDRKNVEQEKWIDWFKEQIDIRPFSVVISESEKFDSISVNDINDDAESWKVGRSVSVARDEKEIVSILKPLIEISNSIIIVDQFFRLTQNNTLAELIKSCMHGFVNDVCIVSSLEIKDPIHVYEAEYKSQNKRNMPFVWIKAPDKFFHDRYFITDVGAIRAGHGFMPEVQKGIHADKANLNIIGKDEADRTIDDLRRLLDSGQANEILRI
ncbi:TPA: hypothetical protein NJ582_000754 [Vibrio parahaemolyticus]|nr:hypothetical protein [Vibrio parahaemolyticus]